MTRLSEGGIQCAYVSKSGFTSPRDYDQGLVRMKKIEKVLSSVLFAVVTSGGNTKIH
jgi:hypothetical protein